MKSNKTSARGRGSQKSNYKKSKILAAIKSSVRQGEDVGLNYEDHCDHHEADHVGCPSTRQK